MSVRLPRPDVYIAALGRSGSTMLANLLTIPPHRWVMTEPRFANGSTGTNAVHQAQAFGFQMRAGEWQQLSGESPTERIQRFFTPRLAGLERWGLKEVRHDLIEPTYEFLSPHRVVVLVRNIRDAATSLVEKAERDGPDRYGDDWLRTYLTKTPAALLNLVGRLADAEYRAIRYEDLVSDPLTRASLSDWLDWPLDGDPSRNLDTIFPRENEVALHGPEVTTKSVEKRKAATGGRAAEIAAWAVDVNGEFQRRFGY